MKPMSPYGRLQSNLPEKGLYSIPMRFNEAFGQVVRTYRDKQQKQLRDLAADSFVALGYLSEIERGQKNPSAEVIESISSGLGVAPSNLIYETARLMQRAERPSVVVPDTPAELFEDTAAAK